MTKGRNYRICPDCGAHLDAGERCDCEAEANETEEEEGGRIHVKSA